MCPLRIHRMLLASLVALGTIAASRLSVSAQAPLPVARLNLLLPCGGRVGSTVEVVAQGSDLDEPSGLLFAASGLSAKAKGGGRFEVAIASNAVPGFVDARFVGRFGVSNPRRFEVTELPCLSLAATNTSLAAAYALALNTVVQSHTTANAIDHYAVDLKRGSRVLIRVLAREIDSRLEPVLSVFGADGREFNRVRRPFLDFTAPADGVYNFKLHDSTFRGGDEYSYRLSASTGPHVDVAVPHVLRAGMTNRVMLYGRNLPGGRPGSMTGVDGRRLDQLAVDIVAPMAGDDAMSFPRRGSGVLDTVPWVFRGTNGAASSLLFALTSHPVVVAPETNAVVAITAPSEVVGRFQARGGLSGASFSAKKGEALWIEVFADRLGLHADVAAVVQRLADSKEDGGKPVWSDVMEAPELEANLGDREFNTASRDCAGRFEAPADGTYRVVVRDLYNLGPTSPHHFYQLSVRPVAPDFRLVALPVQPPKPKDDNREIHPTSPLVRRGGTIPIRVLAFRRDGFGGDIELGATGLPKGCTARGRVLSGQNTGLLLITAAEDVAAWAGWIQVTGRARVGTAEVERKARAGSVLWHLPDYDQGAVASRLSAELALGVLDTEVAPVVATVSEAKPLEAATDAKLAIPVSVLRRGEFTAAFNLKPAGRPELDKAKDTSVAEKATNATVEINLAELKLPEGTHTLWLQGQCAGKYRNQPELAEAADREVKAAEKAAAEATAEAKKATEQMAALKDPKPEAKAAAEKRVAEAAEQVKAAESRKSSLAQKAKELSERAKPRDVVVPVFTPPFTVKITAPVKPPEKK